MPWVLPVGLGLLMLILGCSAREALTGESSPTSQADAGHAVDPFGGEARVEAAASQGPAATVEELLAVVLDTVDPDYRETAKANFLAIARGGESMDYLFLTCFADYAVSSFLLGTGTTPATVTVAYDRRGGGCLGMEVALA